MDFHQQGFLFPPSEQDRSKLSDFSKELSLCMAINALAMRLLWSLEVPIDRNDQKLGALLYIRAVRTCQSVMILTQQGLAVEAQSLCRSAIECAIRIAKLVQDPKFVEVINGEHERHRITQAEQLVKIEKDHHLKSLYAELAHRKRPDGAPHYETLARDVGLDTLYHALYRGISGYAAHATLGALFSHIKQSEDGTDFTFNRQYGPQADHTIAMLVPLLIESIRHTAMLFKAEWVHEEAIRLSMEWQQLCRERPIQAGS
jgi:hypothetical protein